MGTLTCKNGDPMMLLQIVFTLWNGPDYGRFMSGLWDVNDSFFPKSLMLWFTACEFPTTENKHLKEIKTYYCCNTEVRKESVHSGIQGNWTVYRDPTLLSEISNSLVVVQLDLFFKFEASYLTWHCRQKFQRSNVDGEACIVHSSIKGGSICNQDS